MIATAFFNFHLLMTAIRNEKLIKKFGLRVRSLRLERELSQEDLANDAGIPLSQVSRIERGQINASISTAHAISEALNIKLSELLNL